MTSPSLPGVKALVDITQDGHDYASRIEDVTGDTLSLAAPLGGCLEPLDLGSVISLRWNAGVRGRYVAPMRLLSTDRRLPGTSVRCWELNPEGPAQVDRRRRFVRAGGGESVRLRRLESGAAGELSGRVTDISEGGLRGRFELGALPGELSAGEPVAVSVPLDEEVFAVEGSVLRLLRDPHGAFLDVVVAYELGEPTAGMVRRYVTGQQLLARRSADAGYR